MVEPVQVVHNQVAAAELGERGIGDERRVECQAVVDLRQEGVVDKVLVRNVVEQLRESE